MTEISHAVVNRLLFNKILAPALYQEDTSLRVISTLQTASYYLKLRSTGNFNATSIGSESENNPPLVKYSVFPSLLFVNKFKIFVNSIRLHFLLSLARMDKNVTVGKDHIL